ncbi:alpha/beta hydrolase [Winogradskya consettensis]|uniref:Alpha/beta hydrolase n=1 Tax=Winogradskya consettensis TaxID=113560 RepID=A0A919T0X8_9ACTN|nr:alpha/beta hydrolase [Actinoplanes consettensis]GIM80961.1 alpha/beta hydrolase [Actinoplanes consettensis]
MTRQQRVALDTALREHPPATPESIEEIRSGFAAFMTTMAVPGGVHREATTLGGRPALSVRPERDERPGTILYLHGGSFVFGSPETAISLTANLVVRTGVPAVSLDYRLAPGNPFPAAIEDCLAAYRELLERGTDPAATVLAGDSAGGGLAVTTCLAARAAGLPMPAGIVAFSPGLDATRTGASMRSKEGIDPFFTKDGLDGTGALYLAGQDPRQELLSPAIVGDLAGLPPMLLQAGTNELLLDDATRFADRARAAEVDVILDVVAGVPHVFQAYAGTLGEADDALDRAALFVGQRLRNR